MADDAALDALMAHTMLSSVAVVRWSLELLREDLPPPVRDEAIERALQQCELLRGELTDMALGLPNEVRTYLDELRRPDGGAVAGVVTDAELCGVDQATTDH